MIETRRLRLLVLGLTAATLLGAAGCSDDNDGLSVASSYSGIFASLARVTGSVRIDTNPGGMPAPGAGNLVAATVDLSVELHLNNQPAPITLIGTLDDRTGFFSADDGTYALSGTLDSEQLSGSIFGPGFAAQLEGLAGATVNVLCGSWSESKRGGVPGNFSLALGGETAIAAVSDPSEGTVFTMTGTVDGTMMLELSYSKDGTERFADGTVNGSVASGNLLEPAEPEEGEEGEEEEEEQEVELEVTGTWFADADGCMRATPGE